MTGSSTGSGAGTGAGSGSGGRRKTRTQMERALDIEAKKLKLLEQRETERQQARQQAVQLENDDDLNFVKSLVPYLKKVKQIHKLKVRIGIMSVLSEHLDGEDLIALNES